MIETWPGTLMLRLVVALVAMAVSVMVILAIVRLQRAEHAVVQLRHQTAVAKCQMATLRHMVNLAAKGVQVFAESHCEGL